MGAWFLGFSIAVFAGCSSSEHNRPSDPGPSIAATATLENTFSVENFSLNGGALSRHNVKSVTVTFGTLLEHSSISKDDIRIRNISSDTGVSIEFSISDTNGKTEVSVTFNPGESVDEFGGLKNGVYGLNIPEGSLESADGSQVNSTFNLDSSNVDEYRFYRLQGDVTGDLRVGFDDLSAFSEAYGKPLGHRDHEEDFDFDSDGLISTTDLAVFNSSYGSIISGDKILTWCDLDGDGTIDAEEQQSFAAAFDSTSGDANYDSYYDFDSDGRIYFLEYHILRGITRNGLVIAGVPLFGDVNNDGVVGFQDFIQFRSAFETPANYQAIFDFNEDDDVDLRDFLVFRTYYGEGNGALDLSDVTLYGDFDDNGVIDGDDRAIFENAYQSDVNDESYDVMIDADADGVINSYDLAVFRRAIADPNYTP